MVARVYPGPDGFQVGGGGLLHLYLHVAVGRVHVVKLLHAAGPRVLFHLGVEVLVQVQQLALAAQVEPEVVESGILIGGEFWLTGPVAKQLAAYQQQRAEVEVVAHRACLIVNGGMPLHAPCPVLGSLLVVVGVDEGGMTVGGCVQQALNGSLSQGDGGGLGDNQGVVGPHFSGNLHQGLRRAQAVNSYLR